MGERARATAGCAVRWSRTARTWAGDAQDTAGMPTSCQQASYESIANLSLRAEMVAPHGAAGAGPRGPLGDLTGLARDEFVRGLTLT